MPSKKGKSGRITGELLASFKEQLLTKRESLRKNITTELDDMATSEGHHLADMDDLGGDANDTETSYKILEIESAELTQIDEALEAIEQGRYGSCECGKAISTPRLKALPFATLCIDCQRAREKEPD